MNKALIVGIVVLASLAAPPRAQAEVILEAFLTGDQEVPPRTTAAFGTARFVLNDAGTALSFTATFFGIDVTGMQTPGTTSDNLVAAHIHASGIDQPIQPVVWGFFGLPFNDNNPTNTFLTPFATGVGGTFTGQWDLLEGNNTNLMAQIPNLLAGRAYLNFHTVQFPGGEIRGQILLAPEPATLAVLGLGAVVVAGWSRRRRSA